jgi:dihydroorotase (multifunctional complex type)
MILENGVIRAVLQGRPTNLPEDVIHLDYLDHYLLPGLIEVHGHMREPGLTHKETYETGTRAALAGGVTTILDMPNTNPPTTTHARLAEKATLAQGRCYADYGFFFGGARDNADQLATLNPAEVFGVKFFQAGHETTPTTVTEISDLLRALTAMQPTGLTALFHAEHQGMINQQVARLRAEGRPDDGLTYSAGRSPITAVTAISEAVALCKSLGIDAYICHVSSQMELSTLSRLHSPDHRVYCEAVGYHLAFCEADYQTLGAWIKVSPPIRGQADQTYLWETLAADRGIDTLASEHTPHTRAEKQVPFSEASSGTPGIQENLPLIYTEYRKRYPEKSVDLILSQIARLGSANIAHIFGLDHCKGTFEIGKDADVTVFHPAETYVLREQDLWSHCGWSAYTGRTFTGRVKATYLRGEKVFESGKVIGSPRGKRLNRRESRSF